MNYFAHASGFLDDPSAEPYFIAGTAVPDWLMVADRGVRVRAKHVKPLVDDPDGPTAAIARGILQHLADDARFHETRAFAESLLAVVISGFCRERILWDYLGDAKLLVRINQVMRRLGLAELPEGFGAILPRARDLVENQQTGLLDGIPTQCLNDVV